MPCRSTDCIWERRGAGVSSGLSSTLRRTGVAIVENVTGVCLSKKEGDRECNKPTRYLATTGVSFRPKRLFTLTPAK